MSETQDQFSAFRHKSYQRYFISRFLTASATQILSTAVAYQIWEETRNPIWLGWIGLVQFLPGLLLVIATGLASDRFSRRNVMASAIILLGICAGLISAMAATGNFNPIWVLSVLTLVGVARAFHSPASASLAVNIVPKEDFANAISWITSSWQLAHILGPAVAGVLYFIYPPMAYGAAVGALVVSAFLILSIPKPVQKISKGHRLFKKGS